MTSFLKWSKMTLILLIGCFFTLSSFADLDLREPAAKKRKSRVKKELKAFKIKKKRKKRKKKSSILPDVIAPIGGVSIFRAGYNDFSTQDVEATQGFAGGVLFRWKKSRSRFEFESGISYFRAGFIEKQRTDKGVNVDYVSIPFTANFYLIRPQSAFSLYAKGGLIPAYAFSSEQNQLRTRSIINNSLTEYDVLAQVGMGLKIRMGKKNALFFEGNIMHGLVPVFDGRSGLGDFYNQGATVIGGVSIGL